MSPFDPWFAVGGLSLALLVARLLPLADEAAPPAAARFATLDGLRGLAACAVVLHHAALWHPFVRTGEWVAPPSALFNNLGQAAVALFFMLTAFLFTSKLVEGRARGIDWLQLYVSRVLRLLPLYLASLLLLGGVVATLSGWRLQQPLAQVLLQVGAWLRFTAAGQVDINGVAKTGVIDAYVTWSLPYEWLFYFCLPAIALCLRARPPARAWLALLAGVVFLQHWTPASIHLLAFGCGMAAAGLVRSSRFRRVAGSPFGSLVVLTCLGVEAFGFPAATHWKPMLLLGLAFAFVAGGSSLFGLLVDRAALRLGHASYGLYLLHGIALFCAFRFVLGVERAAQLSVLQHWLVAAACIVLLVPVCLAAFRWIELPAMRRTAAATAWLRKKGRPERG